MKRNYLELSDKIKYEIEDKFYGKLIEYIDECVLAGDVLQQDYFDCNEREVFDIEMLLKKIPKEVFVTDTNVVWEFIIIFSAFYEDVQIDMPSKLKKTKLANFFNLSPLPILTIINELAFFSKITGALDDETYGSNEYIFHDIPIEFRRSWVVEKAISEMLKNGTALRENEVDDDLEKCLSFLTYCTYMHGVSSKAVWKIKESFKYLVYLDDSGKCEFKINQSHLKINMKCDEKLFFIIYFSEVFKLIYQINQAESYELVAYLYDLIFYEKELLSESTDKEELIKKRIKRGFGSKAKTNNVSLKKIQALARMRVKSLCSIK